MKNYRRFCAVLIGAVFFIAAVFKLIDPVGAELVVTDYLSFLHLYFLWPLSKAIAVGMALAEALVGAALLTGVWRKAAAIASGVLILVFTGLTVAIWISPEMMECGCFGEVIHLSERQTVIKNGVLCALWLIAFLPFRDFGDPRKPKYAAFSLTMLSVAFLTVYSLLRLPIVDYTPFKPGIEIQQSLLTDLEKAPLLSFSDADGDYPYDLACGRNVMVVSVYAPERFDESDWVRTDAFIQRLEEGGFFPLLLLSGNETTAREAGTPDWILPRAYYSDQRELMTLNRSNGGATYIAEGQIICKRATSALPDSERLSSFRRADPTGLMIEESSRGRVRLQAFLLYAFAVMLLI